MTKAKEYSRESNNFRIYYQMGKQFCLCKRIREAKVMKGMPYIRYVNNRPVAYRGNPELVFTRLLGGELAVWCYSSGNFIPLTKLHIKQE